ncbi:MAG: hypothetical protein WA919_19220 [Coleofasciculaceae cyanobacterium]
MAYWVKVNYERNQYVVELDSLSAFACAPNGRISFWLPNSTVQITLNPQADSEGYQQVLEYVQDLKNRAEPLQWEPWIRFNYERNDYLINLNFISSFCHTSTGRLTFWLPDSRSPIILNPQNDPETYQKLLDYIERKTGHLLP